MDGHGHELRRVRRVLVVVVAFVALVLAAAAPATGTTVAPAAAKEPGARANELLNKILEHSTPPEYRRLGSPGMAAAADLAAATLTESGYAVRRFDVPVERYAVDYSPGHEPLVERVADAATFPADSVMSITATTGPDGITCTVRAAEDVTPGDCGFVPFDTASPEWNNVLGYAPGPALDAIIANGGVGAIVQGDVEHSAVYALRQRKPIPAVVAVLQADDVIGQQVRLRTMGGPQMVTAHDVIAVRRPASGPSGRYLVIQGHMDGWYAAAADNGAGAAAVLAAAEALGHADVADGLVVALYDGEEWGLLGSRAFAGELTSETGFDVGDCGAPLHMGDLAGVVNLDAPSARASDLQDILQPLLQTDAPLFSWRAMVFSEEATLPSLFLTAMAAHQVLGAPIPVSVADPANGGVSRTDGKWFHEAGVPVVWPVAGYPEYHTEGDRTEAVDPVDLANVTAGTVDLVLAADGAPIGPVTGAEPPSKSAAFDPSSSVPTACRGADVLPAAGGATAAPAASRALPATGHNQLVPVLAAAALALAALGLRRLAR